MLICFAYQPAQTGHEYRVCLLADKSLIDLVKDEHPFCDLIGDASEPAGVIDVSVVVRGETSNLADEDIKTAESARKHHEFQEGDLSEDVAGELVELIEGLLTDGLTIHSELTDDEAGEGAAKEIDHGEQGDLFALFLNEIGNEKYASAKEADSSKGQSYIPVDQCTWDINAYNDHIESIILTGAPPNDAAIQAKEPANQLQFASSVLAARLTHFMVKLKKRSDYQKLNDLLKSEEVGPLSPPSAFPPSTNWIDKSPLNWGELFGVVWFVTRELGPLVNVTVQSDGGLGTDGKIQLKFVDQQRDKLGTWPTNKVTGTIKNGLKEKSDLVEIELSKDQGSVVVTLKPVP